MELLEYCMKIGVEFKTFSDFSNAKTASKNIFSYVYASVWAC